MKKPLKGSPNLCSIGYHDYTQVEKSFKSGDWGNGEHGTRTEYDNKLFCTKCGDTKKL